MALIFKKYHLNFSFLWLTDACKKDPVHCVWNPWSIGKCSAECGTGTRIDTRTKKVKEDHGGTCSGSSTRTVQCKDKECPGMMKISYVTMF